MESLNDDTVQAAIKEALRQVKAGDAYMEGGLEEDDLQRILQGEEEQVNKLLHYVAVNLGISLSPADSPNKQKRKAAKSIKATLLSERDKWMKVIQECGEGDGTVAVKKEEMETNGAKADDDEIGASRDNDTTPKPVKAEQKDDAALVTGDTTLSANAGEKKGPADMDVDEAVKIKVETPPPTDIDSPNNADSASDKKQPAADKTNVKQESTPNDGKLKSESESSEQKPPDEMDVDTPVKKEDEPDKPGSGEKRKSGSHKTPRKKLKGSKHSRSKGSSVKKKKARKKARAGLSEAQMEKARETTKKEFEQEKAEILADLPDEYTNLWGQLGYCKWNKAWLPCLVISPFDVGYNSDMREMWMQMYENTKGQRSRMTILVYWYGQEKASDKFSFVTSSSFVQYDKGVTRGYHQLSKPLQKKIDNEKKLTKPERQLVQAHKELEEDLEKQPEERANFERIEAYEDDEYIRTLLNPDLDDSGDELISSDDDGRSLSSASSSDLDSSDSDLDETPKPKKTKKSVKKPKKKAVAVPAEEEELSFAEDEVSSDDSKDEDASLRAESSSSEDEGDEDYIVKETGSKKRASTKPGNKKDKGGKEKKKKASRPPRPKKERKVADTDYARNRAEHRKFCDNEDEYLPILPKWKAAVKDEDLDAIDKVLRDVLAKVDSMGAPFMETYNISPLMNATKKVLKEKNADRTTHKKLMTRLGELYKKLKPLVPDNFKAKPGAAERNRKRKEKDNLPVKSAKKVKREDGPAKSAKKPKPDETETPSLGRNESTSSLPGSQSGSQPSTGPATPVKRVQSQGSASNTPRDSQSSLGSPKPAAAPRTAKATSQKADKPSFSLNRLFNPKPSSSQSRSDADATNDRPSSQSTVAVRSLPLWMTAATPDSVEELRSQQLDRLLALEFFRGVASCFPDDKVNREAIARELESALYQWSLEQYKKEDAYWPKLHAVVAGICGKRQPGTLVAAIMAGEYKSARDVVLLSDDMLLHSFEDS